MRHFVHLMFLFLQQKKSITFKRTKTSHCFTLRERKNLSELTQVFCGLFSPLAAVVSLVTQRHLFPVKAYLHGTTLSHATSLRQAYDMT